MTDQSERAPAPRLGIIISMFPELHETFILRELVALEKRGLVFDIYSLQHPRDPITIDDAIRLSTERTHYSGLINLNTMGALLRAVLTHPLRLSKAVANLVWQGRDRPMDVVKNLAILPITLHIAERGRQRGTTHWHGHWANIPTTACWLIQQVYGSSWSAAIHGEDIFSANRFLRYKLDAASFSVVCSGYFCNHLQQSIGLQSPERIHLNYHGLDPRVMERAADLPPRQDRSDTPLQIISIGRLVPTKGHDVLIKACAALQQAGIRFELQLIGSGPDHDSLQALAQTLGVAEHIVFRGALAFEEVLQTLERADVFCLAPRMIPGHPPDGIPNVIAEAMALGVPVVTTRVSAIPELVIEGETGYLVAVDDDAALADSLQHLAENPAQARRLADASRERVAILFDQQKNISELLDLFAHYVPGQVLA